MNSLYSKINIDLSNTDVNLYVTDVNSSSNSFLKRASTKGNSSNIEPIVFKFDVPNDDDASSILNGITVSLTSQENSDLRYTVSDLSYNTTDNYLSFHAELYSSKGYKLQAYESVQTLVRLRYNGIDKFYVIDPTIVMNGSFSTTDSEYSLYKGQNNSTFYIDNNSSLTQFNSLYEFLDVLSDINSNKDTRLDDGAIEYSTASVRYVKFPQYSTQGFDVDETGNNINGTLKELLNITTLYSKFGLSINYPGIYEITYEIKDDNNSLIELQDSQGVIVQNSGGGEVRRITKHLVIMPRISIEEVNISSAIRSNPDGIFSYDRSRDYITAFEVRNVNTGRIEEPYMNELDNFLKVNITNDSYWKQNASITNYNYTFTNDISFGTYDVSYIYQMNTGDLKEQFFNLGLDDSLYNSSLNSSTQTELSITRGRTVRFIQPKSVLLMSIPPISQTSQPIVFSKTNRIVKVNALSDNILTGTISLENGVNLTTSSINISVTKNYFSNSNNDLSFNDTGYDISSNSNTVRIDGSKAVTYNITIEAIDEFDNTYNEIFILEVDNPYDSNNTSLNSPPNPNLIVKKDSVNDTFINRQDIADMLVGMTYNDTIDGIYTFSSSDYLSAENIFNYLLIESLTVHSSDSSENLVMNRRLSSFGTNEKLYLGYYGIYGDHFEMTVSIEGSNLKPTVLTISNNLTPYGAGSISNIFTVDTFEFTGVVQPDAVTVKATTISAADLDRLSASYTDANGIIYDLSKNGQTYIMTPTSRIPEYTLRNDAIGSSIIPNTTANNKTITILDNSSNEKTFISTIFESGDYSNLILKDNAPNKLVNGNVEDISRFSFKVDGKSSGTVVFQVTYDTQNVETPTLTESTTFSQTTPFIPYYQTYDVNIYSGEITIDGKGQTSTDDLQLYKLYVDNTNNTLMLDNTSGNSQEDATTAELENLVFTIDRTKGTFEFTHTATYPTIELSFTKSFVTSVTPLITKKNISELDILTVNGDLSNNYTITSSIFELPNDWIDSLINNISVSHWNGNRYDNTSTEPENVTTDIEKSHIKRIKILSDTLLDAGSIYDSYSNVIQKTFKDEVILTDAPKGNDILTIIDASGVRTITTSNLNGTLDTTYKLSDVTSEQTQINTILSNLRRGEIIHIGLEFEYDISNFVNSSSYSDAQGNRREAFTGGLLSDYNRKYTFGAVTQINVVEDSTPGIVSFDSSLNLNQMNDISSVEIWGNTLQIELKDTANTSNATLFDQIYNIESVLDVSGLEVISQTGGFEKLFGNGQTPSDYFYWEAIPELEDDVSQNNYYTHVYDLTNSELSYNNLYGEHGRTLESLLKSVRINRNKPGKYKFLLYMREGIPFTYDGTAQSLRLRKLKHGGVDLTQYDTYSYYDNVLGNMVRSDDDSRLDLNMGSYVDTNYDLSNTIIGTDGNLYNDINRAMKTSYSVLTIIVKTPVVPLTITNVNNFSDHSETYSVPIPSQPFTITNNVFGFSISGICADKVTLHYDISGFYRKNYYDINESVNNITISSKSSIDLSNIIHGSNSFNNISYNSDTGVVSISQDFFINLVNGKNLDGTLPGIVDISATLTHNARYITDDVHDGVLTIPSSGNRHNLEGSSSSSGIVRSLPPVSQSVKATLTFTDTTTPTIVLGYKDYHTRTDIENTHSVIIPYNDVGTDWLHSSNSKLHDISSNVIVYDGVVQTTDVYDSVGQTTDVSYVVYVQNVMMLDISNMITSIFSLSDVLQENTDTAAVTDFIFDAGDRTKYVAAGSLDISLNADIRNIANILITYGAFYKEGNREDGSVNLLRLTPKSYILDFTQT
jgi:hypothetical protein